MLHLACLGLRLWSTARLSPGLPAAQKIWHPPRTVREGREADQVQRRARAKVEPLWLAKDLLVAAQSSRPNSGHPERLVLDSQTAGRYPHPQGFWAGRGFAGLRGGGARAGTPASSRRA